MTTGSFGGSVFRQMRGVQRKPLQALAVFLVPSAQNNQCTQAARFGVVCLELPQSYFGVSSSAPLHP